VEPGDLVAISNLAALYERIGRTHDAGRYQEKARKLQQKNPYYHFSLGLKSYMPANTGKPLLNTGLR